MGDPGSLPAALLPLVAEPRWVVWRWVLDVPRNRWTKVPYQSARPAVPARSNDPGTWGDHALAARAVARSEANGIGFMLKDSSIGALDLDDCRDPSSGEIADWAQHLVDSSGSYAEVTVSGTGLRILGTASGSHVHRKHRWPGAEGSLETYRRAARYIVVTGLPAPGADRPLVDIDSLIDSTLSHLDGGKPAARAAARERQTEHAGAAAGRKAEKDLHLVPPGLQRLVRHGVPDGQRSDQFHHAVRWLAELGWSAAETTEALEANPAGIAAKYLGRLGQEVARSLGKAGAPSAPDGVSKTPQEIAPIELHWHGEAPPSPRPWLVEGMIPQTGKGLLAGQWGTAKTFAALDLSACVMTGTAFANRAVARRGGVLFIAAEGAGEIPVRLRGLTEKKIGSGAALPFCWVEECPSLLKDANALAVLLATTRAAAAELTQRHGVDLGLIIVDTLAASAGYTSENDSAEGQQVMNALEELSRASGAFVLGVDHFGKAVETGTRGTSAKEAAADVVLALLADRTVAGEVSHTRLAVRKLRGGSTGAEIPFDLKVVPLEGSPTLLPETTCIIEWQGVAEGQPEHATSKRPRWPLSLRIFRAALGVALLDHGGETRPYAHHGPKVRSVPESYVRAEFTAAYPPGRDGEQRVEAKRKAYRRAMDAALKAGLIGSREIAGIDHLWLVNDEDERDIHKADGQDTS
jgi:hypothetical protein